MSACSHQRLLRPQRFARYVPAKKSSEVKMKPIFEISLRYVDQFVGHKAIALRRILDTLCSPSSTDAPKFAACLVGGAVQTLADRLLMLVGINWKIVGNTVIEKLYSNSRT